MSSPQIPAGLDDVFFAEAAEMLETASEALLNAEGAGNPAAAVGEVFRVFHSVKGGAQMLGLVSLGQLAHKLEDLLDVIRQGKLAMTTDTVSLVLEAMDVMTGQVAAFRDGTEAGHLAIAQQEIISRLEEIRQPGQSPQPPSSPAAPAAVEVPPVKPPPVSGQRLLLTAFTLEPEAAMPEARLFILATRLQECGRVIFSQPDHQLLEAGMAGGSTLTAVLESDLTEAALRQLCDVGDVQSILIQELPAAVLPPQGTLPAKLLKDFNYRVLLATRALANKNCDRKLAGRMVMRLLAWGEAEHDELPDIKTLWHRHSELLRQTAEFWQSGSDGDAQQRLLLNAVTAFWVTVHCQLCAAGG